MLTVLGSKQRLCNGWTRRQLLQAGTGLLGLSLPRLWAAEERGVTIAPRAKSVIFLYLYGGPSQLETFDLKPDAPSGIRGPFRPIDCRTPGLLIGEHLPKLAQLSDKFSVIRTLTHAHNNHHACHWLQTGRPWHLPETIFNATEKDWPAMGSVVEYLAQQSRPQAVGDFPNYVYLPTPLGHLQGYDYPGQYAGWLGRPYNALATTFRKRDPKDNPYFRVCTDEELDFRIQGLDGQNDITLDRLDTRRRLVEQLDEQRKLHADCESARTYDRLRQRAFDLATSTRIRDALDIRREPESLRDRYGRHLFGQATLMGRRLIEAGARFVTVQWEAPDGYSWDSHVHCDDLQKHLLPGLDQALSTLLEDLAERGRLSETLVVCLGEIGRTPQGTDRWGRGHWCHVFPALLAGGGVRGGYVHGTSDKDAGWPAELPVSPADLAATIFTALGIDPELRLTDPLGRPVALTDNGQVLADLFG